MLTIQILLTPNYCSPVLQFRFICDIILLTGEKKVVGGTPYDFRVPRVLRAMIPKIPLGGYDVNFCVTQGTEQDLTFQAR